MEEDEARVGRVCAALIARGIATPLDLGSDRDCAAWAGCDLANMVEGCFHETPDPESIDRRRWLSRLGTSYSTPRFRDDDWLTRWMWLGPPGSRLGTIALPVSPFGRRRIPLYSLYVMPPGRGRGVAGRALAAIRDLALEERFGGIQLETHWAWQRSLRFYLARRMWVMGWKHAITLGWDARLPRWELEETDDEIAFIAGGRTHVRARRRGDRLELSEARNADADVSAHAHATLAVLLAMRGWPLVRSDAQWIERWRGSEVGEVESLAARIRVFEEVHRGDGWDVRTPAIPGVPADE